MHVHLFSIVNWLRELIWSYLPITDQLGGDSDSGLEFRVGFGRPVSLLDTR